MKGLKIRVPENPDSWPLQCAGSQNGHRHLDRTLYGLADRRCRRRRNRLASADATKLFEVMRTATILNHAWNLQPVLINEKFFQSLTAQENDRHAGRRNGNLGPKRFQQGRRRCGHPEEQERGVEFYYPNDAEMDQFRKIGQKAYLETLSKSVSKEWVDKTFKAVAKAEEDTAKGYQAKMK